MWGQIFLEASIQQNFNFGFSTHKSDILLHLSQWQYWWWFWFSLIWVVYYYIIINSITKRTFLFNPLLNTSLRGHGKWGDFLVAVIPLSWCGNILINSNFILRMIEWQNESSLFTLRIQGKQWYWVYKFDATTPTALLFAPKNIGHNKWASIAGNNFYTSDSYYQAIHLAANLDFQDTYSVLTSKAGLTKQQLEPHTLISNKLSNFNSNFQFNTPLNLNWDLQYSNVSVLNGIINTVNSFFDITPKSSYFLNNNLNSLDATSSLDFELFKLTPFTDKVKTKKQTTLNLYINILSIYKTLMFKKKELLYTPVNEVRIVNTIFHPDLSKIDDFSDTMGNVRILTANFPLRILKNYINLNFKDTISTPTNDLNGLFKLKFYNSNDFLTQKTHQTEMLWGFRQKRYKRLKKFLFTPKYQYNPTTYMVDSVSNQELFSSQRNIKASQIYPITNVNFDYLTNTQYVKIYEKPSLTSNTAVADTTYSAILDKQKSLKEKTTKSTAFDYYKAIKTSKKRPDMLSITLARRLLRVKRTLVLPAHVNITVITNSYDVVHSWFIPGLGLKFDCVPGRSTHHTFYIDNIGFYYGQCAEICGRYHHHMPIRVCALSFEQFLVWWQRRGLPRLHRLGNRGQNEFKEGKYYNILLSGEELQPRKYTSYKFY